MQENKTTLVQSPLKTLGHETRWAAELIQGLSVTMNWR